MINRGYFINSLNILNRIYIYLIIEAEKLYLFVFLIKIKKFIYIYIYKNIPVTFQMI